MASTIFFARFIGLILVVTSLAFLYNRKGLDLILGFNENILTVLTEGMVDVVLGLWLVLRYNVWVSNLGICITILGGLFLIIALVSLFSPDRIVKFIKNLRKDKTLETTILIVVLIVGLYFAYTGFNL